MEIVRSKSSLLDEIANGNNWRRNDIPDLRPGLRAELSSKPGKI